MPSSATITAFNVFTAGTKARASEVNTNFSNFRGHILPVDPNTSTSSDKTYALGAIDHFWSSIYTQQVALNLTSSMDLIALTQQTTTGLYLNFAGSPYRTLRKGVNLTLSTGINSTTLTSTTFTERANLGITYNLTGAHVHVGFKKLNDGTDNSSYVGIQYNNTTTSNTVAALFGGAIRFTTIAGNQGHQGFEITFPGYNTTTVANNFLYRIPSSSFAWEWDPGTISGSYTIAVSIAALTTSAYVQLENIQTFAYDIF